MQPPDTATINKNHVVTYQWEAKEHWIKVDHFTISIYNKFKINKKKHLQNLYYKVLHIELSKQIKIKTIQLNQRVFTIEATAPKRENWIWATNFIWIKPMISVFKHPTGYHIKIMHTIQKYNQLKTWMVLWVVIPPSVVMVLKKLLTSLLLKKWRKKLANGQKLIQNKQCKLARKAKEAASKVRVMIMERM